MFNLLEKPWIPCLLSDGRLCEVGIKEALLDAGEYSELRDPSPLATAAVHRLLLAVLHRALGGPKDLKKWMSFWKARCFPTKQISAYLGKWQSRFDLFDDEYPFYQIGRFELDDTRPVTQLAQEFAGGNNPTLFDHTCELAADSWSPAVCARWLVANQAFALGFGRGPTSKMFGPHGSFLDAPLARGAMVILRGGTLFETLMLNLLVYNEQSPFEGAGGIVKDIPAWERDKPVKKPGPRPVLGWIDLLTWQSRCIRLIHDDGQVRHMYYAQGEQVNKASRPNDPMWFYVLSEDGEENAVGLRAERSLWRSSDSLFALSTDTSKGRERRPRAFSQAHRLHDEFEVLSGKDRWKCSLLGLATAPRKAASVVLWAHEELPVPVRLLRDDQAVKALSDGLRSSEDAGGALRWALTRLGGELLAFDPANSGRSARKEAAQEKAASLQGLPYYWAELELPFKKFLVGLGEAPDTEGPLVEWRRTIRSTARGAFRKAAENSLGRSAREMKARVEAEHELNKGLKRIGLGADALKEEVTHG